MLYASQILVVEPAGFLEPTARRRIVEQAYGQWLGSSTAMAIWSRLRLPANVRPVPRLPGDP